MIVWLTGQSGAGKTTIANEICNRYDNWINLDGDEMRQTISMEEGYSVDDRKKHNLRVARLAKLLEEKGFNIILSVIAPIKDVRNEITDICNPIWVYIKRDLPNRDDHFYEESDNYFELDHNELSVYESFVLLTKFLKLNKEYLNKDDLCYRKNCNDCLKGHESKIAYIIIDKIRRKVGDDVIKITNKICPNLTICPECRIDDFIHVEGCELDKLVDKIKINDYNI